MAPNTRAREGHESTLGPNQQAQTVEDDPVTLTTDTQTPATPQNEEEALQKELEYEQRNLRLAEQRALINKARARCLAIKNSDIPTDLKPPPPI
jgi:hypothetical protein